jgi:class 3 adenylate cyclase/dihydrofolate reductase
MGRLVVTAFVTLDGVIEGPGLDEHRSGRNAWALRLTNDEQEAYNHDLMFSADALLLGRTTYQIWAAFWPTAGGDREFAERINGMPKYVVSATLPRAEWANTTIVRGDLAEEVNRLKERHEGTILTYGSADLVHGLMKRDLVDEYRLLVFPVVLGSGKRLFRDESDTTHLHLVNTRVFSSGVVLLCYAPGDEPPSGAYLETYAWTEAQVQSLHAAQDVDRVLATILFTDIVDSTGKAASLGDRPWRRLLDRHDEVARAEVARWHGQLVKRTGDGILARFDAPTRALRCAFALAESLGGIDLRIRAAIHTGEVELRDGDVGGIGVHIAARALAQAGDGDVVVTQTVRDLATGSDLGFTPLGQVGLRGIPGRWELYRASIGARGPSS